MLDDGFVGVILSVFNETPGSGAATDSAAGINSGANAVEESAARKDLRYLQTVSITAF